MKERIEKLNNILYQLRQVESFIKILNVAIEYNINTDRRLCLLGFSELVEEKIEQSLEELDICIMELDRFVDSNQH